MVLGSGLDVNITIWSKIGGDMLKDVILCPKEGLLIRVWLSFNSTLPVLIF